MPGPQELIIILIVVLVLFGGSKIPQIMKGLGQGIKEFKKAKTEIEDDVKKAEIEEKSDKNKDNESGNS